MKHGGISDTMENLACYLDEVVDVDGEHEFCKLVFTLNGSWFLDFNLDDGILVDDAQWSNFIGVMEHAVAGNAGVDLRNHAQDGIVLEVNQQRTMISSGTGYVGTQSRIMVPNAIVLPVFKEMRTIFNQRRQEAGAGEATVQNIVTEQ